MHLTGAADHLPYLDEMLGDEPIVDRCVGARERICSFTSRAARRRPAASRRVAALVEMNPNGTASVGPFWLHTPRGDLDGGYLLDRPHETSAFWLQRARPSDAAPTLPRRFPASMLPQMPPIDSRTVGVTLAGGGAGKDVALAGVVSGSETSIAGVQFDRIEAGFGGPLQDLAVNRIRADGPWGSFGGHGGFTGQQFVAYGLYRGTFDGLRPLIGDTIRARGPVAGTVGIGIDPQRIVVQGSDLHMRGATLRGVPVDRASLTLAIEGSRLRVFSANAQTAGGRLVAAGTLQLAPSKNASPQALSLVAARLNVAQLSGIGLPLSAGTLSAAGNLAAGDPLPTFDGVVAIDGGRLDRFALAGNGNIRLAGDAVSMRQTLGALGGTYAYVDGSIGSLTSNRPSYSLDANVPAGRIAPALHAFGIPNYMTDGSFNARLHVGGRSITPSVSGDDRRAGGGSERIAVRQRERIAVGRSVRRDHSERHRARRNDDDQL